ncbi:MAG: superoxide dismutase [Candidatus Saccharimonas aalborgensis]
MHSLPDLPYDYAALEPVISEEIMRLHHLKHHQTYVDKLNAALEQATEFKDTPLVELLSDIEKLPSSIKTAIRNHGGGHYNHSLFWKCMRPGDEVQPKGKLAEAITAKWGSYHSFVQEFSTAATGLFGSGWVWLTRDLEIIPLPNQDTPMMLGKGEPILGLDVWEHAYYLDYKNKRDEYINSWWKLVNWEFVEERYGEYGN